MKKIFYVLILFLLSPLFVFSSSKTIFQIGEKDYSCAEFALYPHKAQNFISEGFGREEQAYVVGRSNDKTDWPYVLPGSFDHLIGASFWAGYALCKLPVYFEIKELPATGFCRLIVDLLEVASDNPPLFRVYVNGKKYESFLEKGQSGNNPSKIKSHPQQLVFKIPVNNLKKGINEFSFQSHYGNWVVFDAISFIAPEALKIKTPGSVLLKSVKLAEHELIYQGKKTQPLLLDILHKGKDEKLTVKIDHTTYTINVEQGHSIYEVYLPAVTNEVSSTVKVFNGKELLTSLIIKRNKQLLIQPTDYVNQFMGTSGSRWMIAPGPWMPMGMVKISPDNEDSRWKAGYDYQVENIMGFSQVHEWTMAGLLMMPANGTLHIQPGTEANPDLGYRSRINKESEQAKVGCYSVDLTDYNIHADLTATTRASMQRYLLPEEKENRIMIDLHFPAEYIWELRDAEIKKVSPTELEGWALSYCQGTAYGGEQNYKLHFVVQFDHPMKEMGGWVLDRILENVKIINQKSYEPKWAFRLKNYKITDAGAFITFPKGTKEIKVRTGISLISTEQARINLVEEISKPFNWNFEAVVQNQKDTWNKYLSRVEVQTNDYLQKVKFYTNMYRALSSRNTWNDVNGKWMDMNKKVQQVHSKRPLYGSDGYWGWHWNLVPFYNLIAPEIASNWIQTFLEMYDKGGWLPMANPGLEYFRIMVGQPAIPLIVSAYQHGIHDFDKEKMLKALYHQQTSFMEKLPCGEFIGNAGYKYYLKMGYIPVNNDRFCYLSNTLEYAYQDWCVGQYAKALNVDTLYQKFMQRSENWRNIFDKESGFMRPRDKNGEWVKNFNPYHTPGFVEGNSWQYTWYVPHNVSGLVKAMGRKRFIEVLDAGMNASEKVGFNALGDNFSKYPVNHGNQPNMQSCYLFNWAGAPWLTQKWARAIQERYYGTGPRDAYPGDEDQGQMSSWYVMSTIGLFQMNGGCSVNPFYELGSPRFEKVTIHLSDKYYQGETFIIEAENASRTNKYIQSASLNGKKYNRWKIPVKDIQKGGVLKLKMGKNPNKSFAR